MQRTANPKRIAVHFLVMIFDAKWILSDQVPTQLMQILLDGLAAPLQDGLAVTNEAFISMQLDNNAVTKSETDQPRFEFGDAHRGTWAASLRIHVKPTGSSQFVSEFLKLSAG